MEDYRNRNLTKTGKRIVKIAFMRPNDMDNSLTGRIAGCLTANESGKTYSHVEVMFSDGIVTSITQNPGRVHYDETRFLRNPNYRCFFEFYVSPKEEDAMQAFARGCRQRKVEFNRCGMFWNFIPGCFAIRRNGNAYFCSEYVTELLQSVGYLPDLDAARTSPNDLHKAMSSDPKTFHIGLNDKLFYAAAKKTLIELKNL